MSPRLKPTPLLDSYWRFAAERQRVFFRRLVGLGPPWTMDVILGAHRFTNAYRASDRVSQYLISTVIPNSHSDVSDRFFRVLLFKIFNRIDTWTLLEQELPSLHVCDFDLLRYDNILTQARQCGRRVYSAAYIMPNPQFGENQKHTNHLRLLDAMITADLPHRLSEVRQPEAAYQLLLGLPSIGPFLAFQYLVDLNYAGVVDYDESSFVIAGPGAKDGISKCFSDTGGRSAEEVIRETCQMAPDEFNRLGLDFLTLWGRPLQPIDCQNLFCEVDKYTRATNPEYRSRSGRTRIKQVYRPNLSPIKLRYPPKWGIRPSTSWEGLAGLLSGNVLNCPRNEVALETASTMVA